MNTQIKTNQSTTTPRRSERRNALYAGVMLILVGAGLLLFQRLSIFEYFFGVVGLAMMLLGIFTRTTGWMIPGGILGGMGLGFVALETPLAGVEPSMSEGGLFLLCFGAGFVSITLFSKLFGDYTHIWALIPGGILAFLGGMLLLNETGLKVLEFFGSYWPITLILGGAYILYKLYRRSTN